MVEATGAAQKVPCYILDSAKPIWRGELKDCRIVLGMNALAELGFSIMDAKGCIVTSDGSSNPPQETQVNKSQDRSSASQETVRDAQGIVPDATDILSVKLMHDLHLGSQQIRVATVQLRNGYPDNLSITGQIGVITPNESALTKLQCDFVEGYWTAESTFHIPVTNWRREATVLTKDSEIGHVELVTLVEQEDPIWEEDQPATTVSRVCSVKVTSDHGKRLEAQLDIGKDCSPEERATLVQLMKKKQGVFALTDKELGQTDLVEHSIQMNDSTPIRTPPRRLPYALRSELESKLQKLLNIGCIEPSSSPFASGLVLVRKKDGGLRVCVDYRGINKRTIPDCYPIPRIDDLIDTIGRCQGKIFSTLD